MRKLTIYRSHVGGHEIDVLNFGHIKKCIGNKGLAEDTYFNLLTGVIHLVKTLIIMTVPLTGP